MQDFVRALWADALRRRRGGLPAMGSDDADLERMRLSVKAKQLVRVRWNVVKDLVREEIESMRARQA